MNDKDVQDILDYMEKYEERRESLIRKARDVIKVSKQLIYSIHRDDMESAEKFSKKIVEEHEKLKEIAEIDLVHEGIFKVGEQEYVEGMAYYYYVKENRIPTQKELEVNPRFYLMGICDLTGELVRKAINDAIDGDLDSALKIKKVVEDIYGHLLKFDFRDSDLRRNFDRIRRDLKKMEDIALEIKLKNGN